MQSYALSDIEEKSLCYYKEDKMKLYAFWKYDLFSYILGGIVTEIENERVETEEYGKGNCFIYSKILNLKEGLQIQKKLNELKTRYINVEIELKKNFMKERNKIIKI